MKQRNKQIIEFGIMACLSIVITAFIIPSAWAETIYAGENYTFISEEYSYWDVIGNSSNMDGLNVTWESGNITLNFDIRYKPDNFSLIFFNNQTEVIKEIHHYHSGSSSTKYIDKNNTIYKTIPFENKTTEYIDKPIEVEDTKKVDDLKTKLKNIQKITGIITLIFLLVVGFTLWKLNKNSKQNI